MSVFVLMSIFVQIVSVMAFAKGRITGDVNGDGEVTLSDARSVLNHIAKIDILTEEEQLLADFDGDGVITFDDARNILLISVDLPPEYVELQKFNQITPKKSNNGITTKSKFCVVTNYNAETLKSSPVDNKSNPLYTPLLEGTYDYVEKGPVKDSSGEYEFYILKSGRRVYADAVKIFNGYDMPSNKAELIESHVETFNGATKFYLKLDWRVPFVVSVKPQEYEVGYDSRPFNIVDGKFTGSYMDMTFYYTESATGNVKFPESNMIKSTKWIINSENNTATLRIYFKSAGKFEGYNVYYDENNYLVVSVKEPSYSMSDRVIMIDPGHGGQQPGAASGTGLYERDFTYKISLELKKLLEADGATVLFTRDNGAYVPEIEERRIDTYKMNPDMFISIHSNAPGANAPNYSEIRGSEVFYSITDPEVNADIALLLNNAVVKAMGTHDRGIKTRRYPGNENLDYYSVIRNSALSGCKRAFLIEHGFHTNPEDSAILQSDEGLYRIASAECDVLCKIFGK
jgi:N-acetylmuramoyl-L-alanine amidase